MEIVEHLEIEKKSLASFNTVAEMFQFAKDHVCRHRNKEYLRSMSSMLTAQNNPLNEHWFLHEYLWVVYVSGFSAERISSKYNDLLRAHNIEASLGDYIPISKENLLNKTQLAPVFEIFKNRKKAEAIQETRKLIFYKSLEQKTPSPCGWGFMRPVQQLAYSSVQNNTESKFQSGITISTWLAIFLRRLPEGVACHLARNLGNANVCNPTSISTDSPRAMVF